MSSLSKCQKVSEKTRTIQCEDRISKLPACLMAKILSYLPTKNAVATSVLSTNWRQSWTSITHLDFDDELLISNVTPSLTMSSFTSFVNRVLHLVLKETILQRFSLKCSQRYSVLQIEWWVSAALLCHVKEINLSIHIGSCSGLFERLCLCEKLEVLKLGKNFELNVPSLVYLQSLKVLHLCFVKLFDNHSVIRLISGCPLLEELKMRSCIGEKVRKINICSPTLRILALTCLPYDCKKSYCEWDAGYKVEIEAPSLLELEITDWPAGHYILKDANHLQKAKLDLNPYDSITRHDKKALTDLLKGVSQVQFLLITLPCFQVRISDLPFFPNLAHLHVDMGHFSQLLPKFLNNSPQIETLVLEKAPLFHWLPHPDIPSCVVSHLKVVEFMNFDAEKRELAMVSYFLANANVLEKMIIHYSGIRESSVNTELGDELMAFKSEHKKKLVLECSNKILKLPRISKTCQVVMM